MLPLDFIAIRKAICNEVQRVVGVPCVMARPENPVSPRPKLPYMALQVLNPAQKVGYDSSSHVTGTTWNSGGQRGMTVDFNAYGRTQEEAYDLACAWQSALDTETTQGILREAGIAVWLNGSVNDLSELLQTGYEGRAQHEVSFGLAANVTEDRNAIDSAIINGVTTLETGDEIDSTISVTSI